MQACRKAGGVFCGTIGYQYTVSLNSQQERNINLFSIENHTGNSILYDNVNITYVYLKVKIKLTAMFFFDRFDHVLFFLSSRVLIRPCPLIVTIFVFLLFLWEFAGACNWQWENIFARKVV